MNKCLVIFVEGDTEKAFYKALVEFMRQMQADHKFDTAVEIYSVRGVGGFKKDVRRIFGNNIKRNYPDDCEFTLALCLDTDVFELNARPPVNLKQIKKELKNDGANKVIVVQAKRCIEDWFLNDLDGVLNYLNLPRCNLPPGKTGCEKLQKLFKKANKAYIKGTKSAELIAHLNMNKIVKEVQDQLVPLCKELDPNFKVK